MLGRPELAKKVLGRLLDLSKRIPIPPGHIALVYVALGDKDQAFFWLGKAYQQHSGIMAWLKTDPRFDSLRSDSRFDSLLKRVGLA